MFQRFTPQMFDMQTWMQAHPQDMTLDQDFHNCFDVSQEWQTNPFIKDNIPLKHVKPQQKVKTSYEFSLKSEGYVPQGDGKSYLRLLMPKVQKPNCKDVNNDLDNTSTVASEKEKDQVLNSPPPMKLKVTTKKKVIPKPKILTKKCKLEVFFNGKVIESIEEEESVAYEENFSTNDQTVTSKSKCIPLPTFM